jgi:phosphomannomutase
MARLQGDLKLAVESETDPGVGGELRHIRDLLPAYEQGARKVFDEVRRQDGERAKVALKAATGTITKLVNTASKRWGTINNETSRRPSAKRLCNSRERSAS